MAKTTAKTFAYIRVSTKEQNTDRQLDELKKYGERTPAYRGGSFLLQREQHR